MWASGDGGEDDDCAADGYVSSIAIHYRCWCCWSEWFEKSIS